MFWHNICKYWNEEWMLRFAWEKIGRYLLWLVCSHHVLEIILSKVFKLCCFPDIPIFNRFKIIWVPIDRICFKSSDLESSKNFEFYKNSPIPLLLAALKQKSQRYDDYLELIELALVVLVKSGSRHRVPLKLLCPT